MSSSRDAEYTEYVAAKLPSLRRLAMLLCQDWQRADELVQVTITRLYVHWGAGPGGSAHRRVCQGHLGPRVAV